VAFSNPQLLKAAITSSFVKFLALVLSKILNIREIEDVSFRVIYRLTAVHLLKKDRKGEL